MDIHKPAVVKEFMYSERHSVAYSHDRPEGVGSGTQVRYFAQEFQRMSFRLKGKSLRIAVAQDLQFGDLYLRRLPFGRRRHQGTGNAEAGARGDAFEQTFIHGLEVYHRLYRIYRGTIVYGDELVVSESPHPTHYRDRLSRGFKFQQVLNFSSLHWEDGMRSRPQKKGFWMVCARKFPAF